VTGLAACLLDKRVWIGTLYAIGWTSHTHFTTKELQDPNL